jgi:hypothetical protein
MSASQEMKKYMNLMESATVAKPSKTVENKIHKVYRNTDGSATIVFESGDAVWFDNQFVTECLITENNKLDRNSITEAVFGMMQYGNRLYRPNNPEQRKELASRLKAQRADNRERAPGMRQDAEPDVFGRVDPHAAAQAAELGSTYGADSANWSTRNNGYSPQTRDIMAVTTNKPLDQQVGSDMEVGPIKRHAGKSGGEKTQVAKISQNLARKKAKTDSWNEFNAQQDQERASREAGDAAKQQEREMQDRVSAARRFLNPPGR